MVFFYAYKQRKKAPLQEPLGGLTHYVSKACRGTGNGNHREQDCID